MSQHPNENFGVMDQGYFVPRTELLSWINDLLKMLGSGAVYCQLIDVIHPGKIQLNKVNWKAKLEYQFIANLRLLQNAFEKIGIKRPVDVERISKAKSQDNLQFIQWFKRYYDINCHVRSNDYPAEQKRGNAIVDFSFADKVIVPKSYNATGQVQKNRETIYNKRVSSPTSLQVFQRLTNSTSKKQEEKKYITPTYSQKYAEQGERKQSAIKGEKEKSVQRDNVSNSGNNIPSFYNSKNSEQNASNKYNSLNSNIPAAKRIEKLQKKLSAIHSIAMSQNSDSLKLRLIIECLAIEPPSEKQIDQGNKYSPTLQMMSPSLEKLAKQIPSFNKEIGIISKKKLQDTSPRSQKSIDQLCLIKSSLKMSGELSSQFDLLPPQFDTRKETGNQHVEDIDQGDFISF